MGKKGKTGKNRQDKFYHLAKEQGFRSRASFKLVQLNKRFDFLSSAARGILDLCAAPGGWMQIARKHMPVSAPCVGVDLVPIRPIPGCASIVGDITTDNCRAEIRRVLKAGGGGYSDGKVDVVLNDGSPNMGKAWLQDAYTQSELTLAALKLATEFLAAGGSFVTKVFRSNDYNSLMYVMNQLFGKVNATKPSASRAESAEIYVLCAGYRAPKSIDARLLNPKYVFRDMGSASIDDFSEKKEESRKDLVLNTVLKTMTKRKSNRDGYADGALSMYKHASALDFARSPRPVAMICDYNAFSLDSNDIKDTCDLPACELMNSIPETTSEVRHCLKDLKVLGRQEFRLLLKWRLKARSALETRGFLTLNETTQNKNEVAATDPPEPSDDSSVNGSDESEADLENEIRGARAMLEAKEKRKKRKANKLRNALQRKIDMKIVLPGDHIDVDGNEASGLFRLDTALRAKQRGSDIVDIDPATDADADDERDEEEDEEEAAAFQLPYTLQDCSETKEEENDILNKELDHWYKVYTSRKKRDKNGALLEESKERKRWTKRRALRDAQAAALAAESGMVEADNGNELTQENDKRLEAASSASSEEESEEDRDDDVNFGKLPSNSREAALWFSQPVFAGAISSSDDDQHDKDNAEKARSRTGTSDTNACTSMFIDGDIDDVVCDDIHTAARHEARKKAYQTASERMTDGFEVVPVVEKLPDSDELECSDERIADESGSETSFHSSDYDTDEKAEMLAIGSRMRKSSKEATEVLDDAYNRYTFDDPPDLPRWFADPDPTYRARQTPIVTKEQVAEMKAYVKSLQAAPTKKAAEAKARKRARLAKKVEAMKTKANTIAEQSDVPAASRMKAIEALYRQASKSSKSKKRKKQYVAVQSGGSKKVIGGDKTTNGRKASRGVRTVLVDRRMKADKRGIAKAKRRKSAPKR